MSFRPYMFLGKVLLVSTLIAVGIKTLGPHLALPATASVALGMVLFPTGVMACALGLHYYWQRSQIG